VGFTSSEGEEAYTQNNVYFPFINMGSELLSKTHDRAHITYERNEENMKHQNEDVNELSY